jgi:hypothetical protein
MFGLLYGIKHKSTLIKMKLTREQSLIIGVSIGLLIAVFFVIRKLTPFKKRVVEEANREWARFGYQTRDKEGNWIQIGHKEDDDGFFQRVGDYWRNIGWNDTDGRSSAYWSSAFISFIMGGVGRLFGIPFKETHRHSNYINEYVKNRKEGKLKAPFVAYELYEKPAEVGDLLCYAYGDTEDNPYHNTGKYKSHCDIVVNKTDSEIEVIGGNVANSVSKKVLKHQNGYITDTNNRWFAIIKNNA